MVFKLRKEAELRKFASSYVGDMFKKIMTQQKEEE
jgi:hypothetical protein